MHIFKIRVTPLIAAGMVLFATGCNPSKGPALPSGNIANESPTSASANVTAAPRSENTSSDILFNDVTSEYGLDAIYRNGEEQSQFTILESLGGGVGVIDFDRDQYSDLFFPGGGSFADSTAVGLPSQLFRNFGGRRLINVSIHAGNEFQSKLYSHGAFIADANQDGFQDMLVTCYGGLQLWLNQGDGTFVETAFELHLDDDKWSSAAGWGDFNGDGLLDLYVAHYVNWSFDNHPFCRGRTSTERDICPPREFAPLPDTFYSCSTDGTFINSTQAVGLRSDGKGLGVLVADVDGNGWSDIYVANDTTENFLYFNDGSGTFREAAMISGVAADKVGIPNGSMGVDAIDFDLTGRLDIWVTNYEREDFALYRNEGPSAFLHVSDIAGLNILGGLFVGFGTVCADLDYDADEDILVNNGHVILYPTSSPRKQLPLVLESNGRRFIRQTFQKDHYLMQPHEGRGLAVADIDNDGDLDSVYSNINSTAAIMRNDCVAPGNWLRIELVGTKSNRDAIGASVQIEYEDKVQVRQRKGGSSYMSTNEPIISFGLGESNQIDAMTIQWPSGRQSRLINVMANQVVRIVEPVE